MGSIGLTCIVDNSADYRFLVEQLFNRFFSTYPVRLFPSGNAFLEELPKLSEKPGLILLDRHMPELDGHQILLHLKQHPAYQNIPVVMMSADASRAEINGCYEAGANSFLFKPIDFNSLKNTMSVICQYWLHLNQKPTQPLDRGDDEISPIRP